MSYGKSFNRLTAIIKPVQICNMACTYCYVFDSESQDMMTDDVLENTVKSLGRIMKDNGSLEVIWHGGEPSLLGVDFYEKAVSFQKNISDTVKIKNSFQTNAYNLTDKLLVFLKKNNFSVGVSMDGPAFLHDSCRKDKSGRDTHVSVMDTLKRMRSMNIPFGAVCVITKQNKDHIKEIYDFFHGENIPFRINPLINAGAVKNDRLYHEMTVGEYADVVMELFDLWYKDEVSEMRVATIEDIITSLLSGTHTGCWSSPNCQQHFLGIGPGGDVYPCGRFEGNREYCYGNLMLSPLEDVLSCGMRRGFLKRNALERTKCRECKWIKLCHGGCMHNSLEDKGDIMETDALCEAYVEIYTYIEKMLQKVIGPSAVGETRYSS